MKSVKLSLARIIAICLLLILVTMVGMSAGQIRYQIIDLGTLGGPNSFQLSPGRSVNKVGVVIPLGEDLAAADAFAPNCLVDCNLIHGAVWRNGRLTELGSLPGVNDSLSLWISDSGVVGGLSENGQVDPLTGFPEVQAVIWNAAGKILALGGFGGNSSQAFSVNIRGQVVGVALNATPDDFSQFMNFLPSATQARAFLWQNGRMQDLGTLGNGADAQSSAINDNGQIVGFSFTDTTANGSTGIPTVRPFLWQNGIMIDLTSLGGTIAVPGSIFTPGGCCINGSGEVAGTSTLPGDATWHPFLWANGVMSDLQTLGGDNGEAFFINELGDVVGKADLADGTHHAFLWKNGSMTDLGTLPGQTCSTAISVNSFDQVVGDTGVCGVGSGPPFLSQAGGPMVDLNSLVLPGSNLTVEGAAYINDLGEIAGTGLLPNGDEHAVLLVPVLISDAPAAGTVARSNPARPASTNRSFPFRALRSGAFIKRFILSRGGSQEP